MGILVEEVTLVLGLMLEQWYYERFISADVKIKCQTLKNMKQGPESTEGKLLS